MFHAFPIFKEIHFRASWKEEFQKYLEALFQGIDSPCMEHGLEEGGSGGGKFITGSPIRIISTDAPSTELEHEIGRVATDLEGTSCITVSNGIFPFRFLCSDSPPLLRDSAGDRNCGRIAYSAR